MSGQQIGTVVGTVVGAYFGYPQLGAAIGGLIGGAVDPEKFYGPRIGDGPQQSSNEGVPIPWILGVAAVQGNLVQKSARREVRKKDQGKGGPITYTYEAHQDFAIMVCESSETRGSSMVGVQMVKCNGKIVYDVRPGSNFAAESAKWVQGVNFLFGAEDQMPHPTLEAITGVGNTPAYRGVFVAVFTDFNLSEFGDSIPTFEWVMVSEGETVTEVVETLALPVLGEFINSDYPLASPESFYTFTGYRAAASSSGLGVDNFSASTIAEIIAHFNALGFAGIPSNISEYIGYSAASSYTSVPVLGFNRFTAQLDVVNNESVTLLYSEADPVDYIYTPLTVCSMPYLSPGLPEWHALSDARLARIVKGGVPYPQYSGVTSCTSFPDEGGYFPFTIAINPLYIVATRSFDPPPIPPLGDPCLLGVPVQVPDSPGFMVDCAGTVSPYLTYIETSGSFLVLQLAEVASAGGRSVYTKYTLGPIMEPTDPLNTEATWEAAYDAAVIAGTMAAGLVYPTHYPVSISTAYVASQVTTEVLNDAISVATSIERICNRGGLTDAQIDTSEVDQTLLGYPISSQYDASECVRPLLTGYTLYSSEYDAKLHFRKLGADVDVVIDPADFIEGTDESDESIRDQAKEYPRKLSLSYIDIDQNFVVRPQTRQSITPDVRSIGEQSLEIAVVMEADDAAQLVDILWKRSRARVQGRRKFALPLGTDTDCYLQLVPGEPIGVDGKRYMIDQMGLEDGQINLELLFDRQSAYTSDVTAIPALPPTAPPSSINGPTLFAAMNLPVLRDQDDKLGVYVAVAPLLDSWRGCLLQLSRDEGATWVTVFDEMTTVSAIGYLRDALALAPAEGTDVTNDFGVFVHGDELDSITDLQLLNESNPAAILNVDGTAEIIQFQTATQDDDNEYTLSILPRGRLNTAPSEHIAGARFVQLDSVYFVELTVGDIGRELLFRPVSFGSSPDNNAIYPITFSTAVSQTEWRPEYLTGERFGDALVVACVPRHRLGTDVQPVASVNFTGFRWTFTVGSASYTVDTAKEGYTLTEAEQISAFGAAEPSIQVSVSQLNRYTGPGPALEETL